MASLALGCLGGDGPEATPIASPSGASPVAESTGTETPPPPPTPPPVIVTGPVAKTVWLIDASAGVTTTLFESYDSASAHAVFTTAGDRVLMTEGGVNVEYGLDGSRIGPVFQPDACQFKAEGQVIDGRWHPTFQCESLPVGGHPFLSPDGEWFTYYVLEGDPDATPVFPPVSALWALNLQSGMRRLVQDGLQDCGGCDSRFGPEWSPSGRYYFFSETGGAGRVFLTDFDMNATRQIANGNQLGDSPDWAPNEDLLLYRSSAGTTVVEDPVGEPEVLENLAWPARFDPTGEYIYAPAFGRHPSEGGSASTTIVPASAYDVSSQLAGVPEYLNLWRDMTPLNGAPTQVAALARAPGCDGITLYSGGVEVTCIKGGQGATLSPDGSTLAVSRVTGVTGQVSFPGGSGISLNVFEVVLVDVATGSERVVADRAVSSEAPLITWNAGSSHVLIVWPYAGGL